MPQVDKSDPIGEFIALPLDQQLSVLEHLPKGKQDQLLLAVKVRRAQKPYSGPLPPQGSAWSRFVSSAVAPIKGAVEAFNGNANEEEKKQGLTSLYDEAFRPLERVVEAQTGQVDEAEDLAKQGRYSEAAGHALASAVPLVGPWVADAAQQYYGELGSGNIAGAMGTALGNTVLAFVPAATEKVVGTRALKGAMTKSLEATRAGMKGATGISPLDIRETAQNAVDENAKAAEKHLGETHEAVETQGSKRVKAIKEIRESQKRNQAEAEEVREHNQRVMTQRSERAAAERKMDESSQELRARIETAREKALKVGNEKYSPVNEKLNPLPANMEGIRTSLQDALGKIKGTDIEPAILKSISARLEPDFVYQGGQKFGPGTPVYESVKASQEGLPHESKPLDYEDLQGFYSELGRELAKGTLPGDVYTALNTMHEAIGDEMQRIADSQGLGKHLADARNYWRRMKQTFGRPFVAGDVASQTRRGITPEFVKSEEAGNRLRLLGSFDSRIPNVVEHIENLQKGLDSLPKEKPLRSNLKQNPPPQQPTKVPSMQEAEVPERPARNTLSPEKISADQAKELREIGLKKMHQGALGGRLLTGGISTWALAEALRGEWHYAAALGAARVIMSLSTEVIGRLLENENVAKWLAQPTKSELEVYQKLTPEQKDVFDGSLDRLAIAAKSKGMPVSPRWTKFVGPAVWPSIVGPKTKQLQATRDQYRTQPQQ